MPTTINFTGVPEGPFSAYEESGFRFSTATNAFDAFWGGLSISDLGTGDYIFIHNTTDTATVESTEGKVFGVDSVFLDGFRWTGFTPGGDPIPGSSVVRINFIGYKNDGTTVTWSFDTDGTAGFETVVLPEAFDGGLLAFQWYADGGSGLALFDNLVLQENRAPMAGGFTGAGPATDTFIGHLTASDPDGQNLLFEAVGDLPEGVTLDPDGTFYVVPLESDADLSTGESRPVSFQYRVTDGEAFSEIQTVTFTIEGASAPGFKQCGTVHPDHLVGDAGDDTLCGDNQNDTLEGRRGDDVLYGDNGHDILYGEAGGDFLFGGNGKDTLHGGDGDDVLWGANGDDLFVFDARTGDDVIVDFDPKNDQIFFDPSMFGADSTYAGVMSHATQVGRDVVISYVGEDDQTHTITLLNLTKSSLKMDDFLFS